MVFQGSSISNKYEQRQQHIKKHANKRDVANNTPEKLPKTLLRQPHNLPKSPKMPKDVPKMTPRPLEVAPRGLQKAAKRPQDAAKTPSRWLQDAQTILQGAQDPTKTSPKTKKTIDFHQIFKVFFCRFWNDA